MALRIKDNVDLKITKVRGNVIHFELYDKYYFVMNGCSDSTLMMRLYEKPKGRITPILLNSKFGFIPDLIKYKHNNKIYNQYFNKNTPIKFIDIENFINKLSNINFLKKIEE